MSSLHWNQYSYLGIFARRYDELKKIVVNYKPSDNENSIAYIDTCAQDNVWRIDSGMKYLRNVDRQYGKAVIGVTGDKKPLNFKGKHDVIDKVHLGDVTSNLISLPKILDRGGAIYGNDLGCMIWDRNGNLIIRGIGGNKNMYQCNLENCKESKIKVMKGDVIDKEGVVYEKHLSGEEVERAKLARKRHERNHINELVFGRGLDEVCYQNINELTSKDVNNSIILFGRCKACIEGSMNAPPKRRSNSTPAPTVGYILAMDLWPLSETSLGGNNWGLQGIDEKSGYLFAEGLKRKGEEELQKGILTILLEIKSYGHTTKEILFDNEQVFNAVGRYVRSLGIEPLYTLSGLHNNLAERYTQFVKTKKGILLCFLPYNGCGYYW